MHVANPIIKAGPHASQFARLESQFMGSKTQKPLFFREIMTWLFRESSLTGYFRDLCFEGLFVLGSNRQALRQGFG